jgi:iron complex transport system substrate-binding protein
MRIVSLLPSNTEILDSLGASDEVVGVSNFDKLDPHRKTAPERVGDLIQPNLEKIVSLKPDLIVAGLWKSSRAVPSLRSLGYSVLEIPSAHSIAEIYDSIRTIAKAIGRPAGAGPIIEDMRSRLVKVQERSRRLPQRYRVYIEIDRGNWTVGGQDFISEAAAIAGADNIFSDLRQPAASVSPETIVKRNPEVVICFDAHRDEIVARPAWNSMTAVQKGWIIDNLDPDELTHPSPRLAAGVEALLLRLEGLSR